MPEGFVTNRTMKFCSNCRQEFDFATNSRQCPHEALEQGFFLGDSSDTVVVGGKLVDSGDVAQSEGDSS